MRKPLKPLLLLTTTFFLLISSCFAEEQRGSSHDAQQMVEQAVEHVKAVGPAKAFQDFSTPGGKWHVKDVYLFCYKLDGTNMCHGANKALIGKNLMELKTADGQLLIQNFVNIVRTKGAGWIEYQWPHPGTKKTEIKRAYVMRIPDYDGLVGAGCYPQQR